MSIAETLGAGTLLDARGRLREAGWSRRPLLSYERSAVSAPLRRIKEWDRYCVLCEDYGLFFSVSDLGYAGVLAASLVDFEQGRSAHDSYLFPFTLGSFSMPASSEKGDVRVRHRKGQAVFAVQDGGARIVKFDLPAFDRGLGLRGALVLTEQRGADSYVAARGWPAYPDAFFYSRKLPGLGVEGVARYGDRELVFYKDKAFGVLDWGRGVRPRQDDWCWASASALVDGRPFAFSVGSCAGETGELTENCVFRDGVLHKLGSVTFHINPRDWLEPWRFTSDDGRLELSLEPVFDLPSSLRMLAHSSLRHQVYGRFSGRVVLDDGEVLEIKNLTGYAEKAKNRW